MVYSFCDSKPKLINQSRGPITFISLAAAAAVFGGVLFYYENEKDKTVHKVTREVVTVGETSIQLTAYLHAQYLFLSSFFEL